jgi:two-component system, response regulator YesN
MADLQNAPTWKLLLVEDDKDTRELLLTILRAKFPDLDIFTAVNGRDAVEQFKALLPDVVVTDVNMPEMNGLEMAGVVRKIKPAVKIVVVTADTGKDALERAMREGLAIDHYVLKPVDFQHLFHAVELCLAELAPV